MRKCLYLPVPDEIRALAPPQVSRAALPSAPPQPPPAQAQRVEPSIPAHRRDPRRDVREMPAYPYAKGGAEHAEAMRAYHALRAADVVGPGARSRAGVWWEDPVAIGSLLILLPPLGLAAVWASKRYSNDARWALTVMTALMMCLVTAVAIALVATH